MKLSTVVAGQRPWGHLYRGSYRSKKVPCPGVPVVAADGSWECRCAAPCDACACDHVARGGPGQSRRHGQIRHSAVWCLKFYYRRKSFHESTRTSDWNKAQAYRKRRFLEIYGGADPSERKSLSLADALALIKADYAKRERRSGSRLLIVERHLLAFRPFLAGALPASEVSEAMVNDDYVLHRKGQGAASATIRYELVALRRALVLASRRIDPCTKRPLLARVPYFDLPPPSAPREIVISAEEGDAIVEALRRAGEDDIADLVLFYRLTGWRNREPRYLTWKDVDWFGKLVFLRAVVSKSGKPFELPFGPDPELTALLEKRRRLAEAIRARTGLSLPWVFFRRHGHRRSGIPWSETAWLTWSKGGKIVAFGKEWTAALRAAGLPDHGPEKKHPHDFRRLAAGEAIAAGTDMMVAAALVGWSTTQMLQRYRVSMRAPLEAAAAERARRRRREAPVVIDFTAAAAAKAGGGDRT